MKIKKQFIAGAVCPECSNMDSLVLYADTQSIVCVECNFSQSSEQRDTKSKKKDSIKNSNKIKITNLDD